MAHNEDNLVAKKLDQVTAAQDLERDRRLVLAYAPWLTIVKTGTPILAPMYWFLALIVDSPFIAVHAI